MRVSRFLQRVALPDGLSRDHSDRVGDVSPQWPVPSHGMNVQVMFNAAQMLPQLYAEFFILRV